MRKFLLLASLVLFASGCEIRPAHHGHSHSGVVLTPSYPDVYVVDEYEEFCYESCCFYYEYYDAYPYVEVCEVMECYNPYTDYYEYEGEDCWYE